MAYQRTIEEDPEHIELALDVVRISIVAVIFLAPLGAIIMMISGPLLLNKITIEEQEKERRLSYLHIRSLQPVRTRRRRRSNTSIIIKWAFVNSSCYVRLLVRTSIWEIPVYKDSSIWCPEISTVR